LRIRVPECEILTGTPAVRNLIRQGQFYKLQSALTTGAKEGMYTFERYQAWMEERTRWSLPSDADRDVAEDVEPRSAAPVEPSRGSPGPGEEIINLEPTAESISEFVSRLKPAAKSA